MICPNRSRRVRLSPAGGSVGCRGQLVVVLTVPVMLPVKSMFNPRDAEKTLKAGPRRHGVRVSANDLAEALRDRTRSDVRCSSCGWSLAKLEAACRRKRRSL